MIKLEKGVPMPNTSTPGTPKYRWAEMEIGDSFFVPGRTSKTFSSQVSSAQFRLGRKFSARTMDGGVRVWRVA